MASFSLVVLGEQALVGTGIVVDVKADWTLAKVKHSVVLAIKEESPVLAASLPPLLLSSTANGELLDGGRTLESYGINDSTSIHARTVPVAGGYSHEIAALFAFNRLND